MTATIAIDVSSLEAMELLEPHYDIHSTAYPGVIKKNVTLPSVIIANKARWLAAEKMVIQ